MQEAMMALHKVCSISVSDQFTSATCSPRLHAQHILGLEDSFSRQFLEQGMHALHRRSGPLQSIPDEFVITSLDVIIYHDKKLGGGGYGAVFQGEWHGTTVAVKMLEKGVPPYVSLTDIPVPPAIQLTYLPDVPR
jgi:hypothetical protein